MKKTLSILMTAVLLSACAGSGSSASESSNSGIGSAIGGLLGGGNSTSEGGSTTGGLTRGLIQMYVKNQCATNLQARNEWRLAALAMSAEKQAEWEDKICGCVTEEAPNHITAADLTGALTESGRAKLMTEVTTKTVTACYKRLFTSAVTGS